MERGVIIMFFTLINVARNFLLHKQKLFLPYKEMLTNPLRFDLLYSLSRSFKI